MTSKDRNKDSGKPIDIIDENNDNDLFRKYIASDKNIKPLNRINKVDLKYAQKQGQNNQLKNQASNKLSHSSGLPSHSGTRSKHLEKKYHEEYIEESITDAHNLSTNLWRPPVASQESFSYFQPGVQAKTISSLKNGKVTLEAILDLHQKNAEQAAAFFHQFITNCYQSNLRFICVVHGKGIRGDTKQPLLKNLVHHWLYEYNVILGFCSCPPSLGGTGATLILLKNKHKQIKI